MKADAIPAKIADGVNVIDKIVLNDYIDSDKDILHENNFFEVMKFLKELVHFKNRKPVWLYTENYDYCFLDEHDSIRKAIVAQYQVFVEKHPYNGSKSRIIDIQKTLRKGRTVLWDN